MKIFSYIVAVIFISSPALSISNNYRYDHNEGESKRLKAGKYSQERLLSPMADIVTLGDRPYHLLDAMRPSALKDELIQCATTRSSFKKSDFSISHRGANLHYPEHTERSLKAASLMGAGILECDVTFTSDHELVCRHSQCDLHHTTDVVTRPEMNAKCTIPWSEGVAPQCCTSDFTLEELKTLCAKMDTSGANVSATLEFGHGGISEVPTNIHQYECPSILTHREYIGLIMAHGGKYTPELKTPEVDMPYDGQYTQQMYAQQMIDEYIEMDIDPEDVWPQSFNIDDAIYWIEHTDFGEQVVLLDERYNDNATSTFEEYSVYLKQASDAGVHIVAPHMSMLVQQDESAAFGLVESDYTKVAKQNGLEIITWTLERISPYDFWDRREGSVYELLYVLAHNVEILGIHTDWPAPVTFFANCMNLGLK